VCVGNDEAATTRAWAVAETLRRRVAAGGTEIPVITMSMAPLARPRDTFLISPLTARPRRGDVVLAVVGGRAVTHRVLGRRAGRFILKGDNSPRADGAVSADCVVGRAHALKKRDGRVVKLDAPLARVAAWLVSSLSGTEDLLARAGLSPRLSRRAFYVAARIAALPYAY